jgi:hypothetical protein
MDYNIGMSLSISESEACGRTGFVTFIHEAERTSEQPDKLSTGI